MARSWWPASIAWLGEATTATAGCFALGPRALRHARRHAADSRCWAGIRNTAYGAGDWLALAGEPGVGKLAVVRAVFQSRNPSGRLRIADAGDATQRDWLGGIRRSLAEGPVSLVVRHVDRRSNQVQLAQAVR